MYKLTMEKNTKSKIAVIGFVAFVVAVYTGSYFYTKSNNERLLSSPRLVLLVGSGDQVNDSFSKMNTDQRRAEIRTMASLGRIWSLSQAQYDTGTTDIIKYFSDHDFGDDVAVADCLEYSERIKQTMEVNARAALKRSWIFYACGIID